MSQVWWSRAKLSEEGGNHGNPEAATTHQEAPSHWRTQWNTYQPHKAGTNPRAGGMGENCELASVTASETDSCKHQTACKGHQVPLLELGPPQALGAREPAANVIRVSTRLRVRVTRCPCEELGRPRSFGRPRTATTACRRHVLSWLLLELQDKLSASTRRALLWG